MSDKDAMKRRADRIEEALKGRGGGGINIGGGLAKKFETRLHPHDREGKFAQTFTEHPHVAKHLPVAGSPGRGPGDVHGAAAAGRGEASPDRPEPKSASGHKPLTDAEKARYRESVRRDSQRNAGADRNRSAATSHGGGEASPDRGHAGMTDVQIDRENTRRANAGKRPLDVYPDAEQAARARARGEDAVHSAPSARQAAAVGKLMRPAKTPSVAPSTGHVWPDAAQAARAGEDIYGNKLRGEASPGRSGRNAPETVYSREQHGSPPTGTHARTLDSRSSRIYHAEYDAEHGSLQIEGKPASGIESSLSVAIHPSLPDKHERIHRALQDADHVFDRSAGGSIPEHEEYAFEDRHAAGPKTTISPQDPEISERRPRMGSTEKSETSVHRVFVNSRHVGFLAKTKRSWPQRNAMHPMGRSPGGEVHSMNYVHGTSQEHRAEALSGGGVEIRRTGNVGVPATTADAAKLTSLHIGQRHPEAGNLPVPTPTAPAAPAAPAPDRHARMDYDRLSRLASNISFGPQSHDYEPVRAELRNRENAPARVDPKDIALGQWDGALTKHVTGGYFPETHTFRPVKVNGVHVGYLHKSDTRRGTQRPGSRISTGSERVVGYRYHHGTEPPSSVSGSSLRTTYLSPNSGDLKVAVGEHFRVNPHLDLPSREQQRARRSAGARGTMLVPDGQGGVTPTTNQTAAVPSSIAHPRDTIDYRRATDAELASHATVAQTIHDTTSNPQTKADAIRQGLLIQAEQGRRRTEVHRRSMSQDPAGAQAAPRVTPGQEPRMGGGGNAPGVGDTGASIPGATAVVRGKAGRWVKLNGKQTHVPHHEAFTRQVGNDTFTSPAGSTHVFKNGEAHNAPRGVPAPTAATPPPPRTPAPPLIFPGATGGPNEPGAPLPQSQIDANARRARQRSGSEAGELATLELMYRNNPAQLGAAGMTRMTTLQQKLGGRPPAAQAAGTTPPAPTPAPTGPRRRATGGGQNASRGAGPPAPANARGERAAPPNLLQMNDDALRQYVGTLPAGPEKERATAALARRTGSTGGSPDDLTRSLRDELTRAGTTPAAPPAPPARGATGGSAAVRPELAGSPARSSAGRLRNFQSMSDEKLVQTDRDLAAWHGTVSRRDSESERALLAERQRRGLVGGNAPASSGAGQISQDEMAGHAYDATRGDPPNIAGWSEPRLRAYYTALADEDVDGESSDYSSEAGRQRAEMQRVRQALAAVRAAEPPAAAPIGGQSAPYIAQQLRLARGDSEEIARQRAESIRNRTAAGGLRAPAGANPPRPEMAGEPGRSSAGRLRNFAAMGDTKLAQLAQNPSLRYDGEASSAVQAEMQRRGLGGFGGEASPDRGGQDSGPTPLPARFVKNDPHVKAVLDDARNVSNDFESGDIDMDALSGVLDDLVRVAPGGAHPQSPALRQAITDAQYANSWEERGEDSPDIGEQYDALQQLIDVLGTEVVRNADVPRRVQEAEFSSKQRGKLADKGHALPDGSFPIRNGSDLSNAIQALGRAKDKGRARAHIISRAKALGLTSKLPDDWSVKEAALTPMERRVLRRVEITEGGTHSTDDDAATEAWLINECAHLMRRARMVREGNTDTPEPFSKSKTSNWVAKGGGLPHYIQHIAHDLMERKGGMDEARAIQMAIGIVKRWAKGVGKVTAETRAKAAKAVAEWESLKAKAHARTAAKVG